MQIYLNFLLLLTYDRKNKIQSLSVSEERTREKMLFFKRELENREETFTRLFAGENDASNNPLRVIQHGKAKASAGITKQAARGGISRKKGRCKTGAGTRKKKPTVSAQGLPKIAK